MLHQNYRILSVAALGALLLSGCVVRERYYGGPRRGYYRETVVVPAPVVTGEVVVQGPPPPLEVEVVPPLPGPGYIWVGGAWVWSGRWVWERGHYVIPPHPGMHWHPHEYAYRNGVHVWIRGGWR